MTTDGNKGVSRFMSDNTEDKVSAAVGGEGAPVEEGKTRLVIEFDKAGSKHVVAKFVVSADQADDVPF